jgi:dTMP kinase
VQSIDRASSRLGGVFITLEGPDGAGKSTQQQLLVDRLRNLGREVVATREPGGTPLGERIRAVLLETPMSQHDGLTDALLFNAARRRLVAEVIRPALSKGAIVISDRFSDSTIAYQGSGSQVPIADLKRLAELSTGSTTPNRTVLFDLPAELGLERRHQGSASGITRFELTGDHDAGFQDRVRNSYLQMAQEEPDRWRVVDAAANSDDVAAAVWEAVRDLVEP